jgi:hypothetical protein
VRRQIGKNEVVNAGLLENRRIAISRIASSLVTAKQRKGKSGA